MKKTTLILALAVAPAALAAPEPGQHDAHVHGVAHLDLVLAATELSVTLEAPAESLLGFEHAPATDEQARRLAQLPERLRDGVRLLGPAPAAGCRQVDATLDSPLLPRSAAHDGHAHEHADVRVQWSFQCAEPAALRHLSLGLFAAFPGVRELRVQAIGPGGQRGARLSAARPELKL